MSLLIEALGRLVDLSASAAELSQKYIDRRDPVETTYKTFDGLSVELTKHKKTGLINLNVTSFKGNRPVLVAFEITPATAKHPQEVKGKTYFQHGGAMVLREILSGEDAKKAVDALWPRLT